MPNLTNRKERKVMHTSHTHPEHSPNPIVTKAGEFKPMIDVPFVVKDLFKPGEVAMVAGAPGLGKSTIMAAIASHAAQGRNFAGLSVEKTVVIYYAAEDAYGVNCRAYPYMHDPACANAPFYVVHGAPNLLEPEAPEKIARFVKTKMIEHNCDQSLVIFDTLNRITGGRFAQSWSAGSGGLDRSPTTTRRLRHRVLPIPDRRCHILT